MVAVAVPPGVAPVRMVPSERGWWLLGPGGRARLGLGDVTADGTLSERSTTFLRGRGLFDPPPVRAYALTVLTGTECNLGCAYCFQNTGQDPGGGARPPRIPRRRLDPSTIDEVLAFADARMAAAGLDRLALMLFGGEPLLNRRGCAELLARAAGHGLAAAAMTSNATLLAPAVAAELEALGLRSVQVTFDGDRPDHDRVRVRRGGPGRDRGAGRDGGATFDRIVANLAAASAVTGLRWHLRVNVSTRSADGVSALLDRLAGELDATRCGVSFEPVGDVGIGYRDDLRLHGRVDQFVGWHRQARALGFRIPVPAAPRPCLACSFRDGRFGAVVGADGGLFSCWETAGRDGWQVGTVRDGYWPVAARRWVSCRDLHRPAEEPAQVSGFHDSVDGAVLDLLDGA